MSTYFDAANRGPRLRTASAGIIRQPAANAAPCFQQPPRSVPHQTLVGLTPNTVGLRDSLGHVIKRQKTDNGYIFTASPIESYVKHESPTSPFQESPQSAFRPPTHSDQVSSSRSPISTNPPLAPPLPLKPCNQVLRKSRPTPTHAYHVRRDEVQAKPYKLEIPSSTPQFGKHGKLYLGSPQVPMVDTIAQIRPISSRGLALILKTSLTKHTRGMDILTKCNCSRRSETTVTRTRMRYRRLALLCGWVSNTNPACTFCLLSSFLSLISVKLMLPLPQDVASNLRLESL